MSEMKAMPMIPGRGGKATRPCACGGCGRTTHRTWAPGHDGHCTGWALAVGRGDVTLAGVPEMVRAGVALRMKALGITAPAAARVA